MPLSLIYRWGNWLTYRYRYLYATSFVNDSKLNHLNIVQKYSNLVMKACLNMCFLVRFPAARTCRLLHLSHDGVWWTGRNFGSGLDYYWAWQGRKLAASGSSGRKLKCVKRCPTSRGQEWNAPGTPSSLKQSRYLNLSAIYMNGQVVRHNDKGDSGEQ